MSVATVVFLLVVVGALTHILLAIGTRTSLAVSTRAVACAAVVFVWLVVPGVLAARGALDRYAPLPAPALMLIASLGLATVLSVFSPVGTALSALPLVWLVGFQSFRLAVEWWLHHIYLEGRLPVQMTFAGRNFDIVSGLTALALGLWLAVGRPPRVVVLLWNIVGLALLANVVITGIFSTPTPFRYFTNDPPNLLLSTFPDVWLPSFLVQAALAGHLLVFRALRRTA